MNISYKSILIKHKKYNVVTIGIITNHELISFKKNKHFLNFDMKGFSLFIYLEISLYVIVDNHDFGKVVLCIL